MSESLTIKICKKHGDLKHEDCYFPPSGKSKECRKCRKENVNPEKSKEYNKNWRLKNPEKVKYCYENRKEYYSNYYKIHKEKIKLNNQIYYKNNKDKINAREQKKRGYVNGMSKRKWYKKSHEKEKELIKQMEGIL